MNEQKNLKEEKKMLIDAGKNNQNCVVNDLIVFFFFHSMHTAIRIGFTLCFFRHLIDLLLLLIFNLNFY